MSASTGFAIGVLVKQIPAVSEMRLGSDGRLQRVGLDTEMNAYCRRAVAKAVEVAVEHGGRCTVMTLGPEPAEDVLREALAWGDARGVTMAAVHACDPLFAGSDTLATAQTLAALVRKTGPFDLILVGRCSLDADTGQVGPQLAQLLDVPFATAVRELTVQLDLRSVTVRCEHDDGWLTANVALPAVLSTAERLTDPCKMAPPARAEIAADRIRRISAAELGTGPWGDTASPTKVGDTRLHEAVRDRNVLTGPVEDQVAELVSLLADRGVLDAYPADHSAIRVPDRRPSATGPVVAALIEPDRERLSRELLTAAAQLAEGLDGQVVAIGPHLVNVGGLGSWGADHAISLAGSDVEDDIAEGVSRWAEEIQPSVVLAPSTAWGREVASRVAAARGAGLVGDAVAVELVDGRLIAWKPAFGGQLVAAISSTGPTQMATVRAGALPIGTPRSATALLQKRTLRTRGRVQLLSRTRDDDLDALAEARAVVGIGSAITRDDHELLAPLLTMLDAELAATRKVTDRGQLPRARQIGITGRSIAPRLYLALATSGKFNHTVGFHRAHTVVAVNNDAAALIFDSADIGLVADWRDVVTALPGAVEAHDGLV